MATTLTPKRRKFINAYAKTGNGTLAAKQSLDVTTENSAASSASRMLRNVNVKEKLDSIGFNEISAKSVVVEIMEDKKKDPNARLKATDQVFKVEGSYAPEKSLTVNIEVPVGKQKTATDAIVRFLNGNS